MISTTVTAVTWEAVGVSLFAVCAILLALLSIIDFFITTSFRDHDRISPPDEDDYTDD